MKNYKIANVCENCKNSMMIDNRYDAEFDYYCNADNDFIDKDIDYFAYLEWSTKHNVMRNGTCERYKNIMG